MDGRVHQVEREEDANKEAVGSRESGSDWDWEGDSRGHRMKEVKSEAPRMREFWTHRERS